MNAKAMCNNGAQFSHGRMTLLLFNAVWANISEDLTYHTWNITVDIRYMLEHCPDFAVIREMCSKQISKEMLKISNAKNIVGITHSFVCTQFSGSCNCSVKGLQLETGCPVEDYFKL
jgi:hypothetical protein